MEQKELKAIGKILTSAKEDGEELTFLNRNVSSFSPTQHQMVYLADQLLNDHPTVAFLLTHSDDKKLQYILAISPSHPLMGKNREHIFHETYNKLYEDSLVLYPHDSHDSHDANQTYYFSREILDTEYVGKIMDSITSIIFTYLKKNNYLPEEKDDEDPYLDFDNF